MAAAVQTLHDAGFGGVGTSAGLAFYPDDALGALELVELADARMYAEKRARKEQGQEQGQSET